MRKMEMGSYNRISEDFKNCLVDLMEEGILVEDDNGNIVLVNPRTCEMLGYSEKEILGKHWAKIVPKEHRKKVEKETKKRPMKVKSRYETFLLSKKGEKVPVIVSASPLFDDGNFKGVLSVFTDISEKKKMEQKLKKAYEELKEVDRMKSEFIEIASHELRTPLTMILLSTEMMESMNLNDDLREKLEILRSGAERLEEIVHAILISSKLMDERKFLEKREVSLARITGSVINQTKSLWTRKNQTIDFEVTERIPKISCDVKAVFKVILNLLHNAIKYSQENARIIIKIRDLEDSLKFTIIDEGIGIKEEEIPKIFEKFHIVGGDDYARIDGRMGLGLYIVREIVEKHGGKIWCESVYGLGSTFHFTLPKVGK
ncbi:MAG: ATP-binding protein [Candidatus Methanofastidiosia archaeon]